MNLKIALLLCFMSLSAFSQLSAHEGRRSQGHSFVDFLTDYLSIRYPDRDFSEFVYISVKKQRLYLIRNNAVVEEFVISTAVNGVGNKMDSEQTPTGLHSVEKMIGEGVPENGIFINRVFNGDHAQVNLSKTSSQGDMVTGRIIWLKGEEEGVNSGGNVDSYSRNIYIHGTPDVGLLGMPASHGCIRMSNKDVVSLFKQMRKGDYVIILNN